MNSPAPTSKGYVALLSDLKARIGSAQVRAAVAVKTELVPLHCQAGSALNARVQAAGWGAKCAAQRGTP